jgi:hypothetical protein
MDLTSVKRYLYAGVLLLLPTTLPAITIDLFANMDGAQANAGVGTGSAGTGSAAMTFDTDTSLFSWDISWSGLTGTETAGHFHGPALLDQNAGVQVPIDVFSNPSMGSTTLSAAQSSDLLAGLWYINIHTDFAPGGEIRGQVQVVPVPAAAWLFLSGLVGLGLLRKAS